MYSSNVFFVLSILFLIASIVLYHLLQIRSIRRSFKNNTHKKENKEQEKNHKSTNDQGKRNVLHPTVLLDEDEEQQKPL
ncbi:hypothetical protein [Eubacterium sp. 1001713B170207_170306_E7]|uniref:hypothetical protein n=1 Tax=Eubacterium sp. 1001713B170207_170306_E7 TaxID=2787097 RepID=UPI001899A8EF|nr:hypothetical protein [Eubacterium sp. 1001713B170207_170306_E7]